MVGGLEPGVWSILRQTPGRKTVTSLAPYNSLRCRAARTVAGACGRVVSTDTGGAFLYTSC